MDGIHPFSHLALIQNIGMPELLIIGFIVLLLFGAKRLPELFRSMGKSIGEFKKATREIEEDIRTSLDTEEERSSQSPGKPDQGEKANASTTPTRSENQGSQG